MELTVIAALLSTALLLSNLASILLASSRLKRPRTIAPPAGKAPPVSIVVPSRGVEPFTEETLERAFSLDWPRYELIFCVAHADDPVVKLIRAAIAALSEGAGPAARRRRPRQRQSETQQLRQGLGSGALPTGSSLPIPTS